MMHTDPEPSAPPAATDLSPSEPAPHDGPMAIEVDLDTEQYRVPEGRRISLADYRTHDDGGLDKAHGKQAFRALRDRLVDLQENLYAEGRRSLLVVFQAMDAGGKDSTTKAVFGPVDPAGCRVKSFKAPNSEELGHDFLWRVHQNVPKKGYIGVFNRSHYEDAVTVAVKDLAPKDVWKHRVEHINNFEHLLHTEGTRVVKFFLHISKDYQKVRLQRRLDRPDKHWKFNPADLDERARWGKYQERYAEVFGQTSPADAPWYVIPAERRWYRNLLVCKVLVDILEDMNPQPPKPDFDPTSIVIE
ncbi:MAG: PPK2 family polyphosphate kinase [Phycisphaerales bacterium JB063]